jgi:hypothetical protein
MAMARRHVEAGAGEDAGSSEDSCYRRTPEVIGMDWQDAALALAGLIGGGTALVHGILTQRHMVRPIAASLGTDRRISAPIRRLVPLLLHFSTFAWFLGGLALIAAAAWSEPDARLATSLCVGGLYLYGALANLWATRGRHPGVWLMAAALVLVFLGAGSSGG